MQLSTVIEQLRATIQQKTEYLENIGPPGDIVSEVTSKFLTINLVELNNILDHLLKVDE